MWWRKKAAAEGNDPVPSGAEEDASGPQVREKLQETSFKDGDTAYGDEDAGSEADNARQDESAGSGPKNIRFKKILLFGSLALCLLLAAAGFFFIKFKMHTALFEHTTRRLEPITSIMRPIPLPDYREMLDFLLVYDLEGQKMITAIRMEVEYQSPTRYQNFKEQKVNFRDAVYNFLLKQNMPGNSVKSWHSVLEKDLPDCLRAEMPQSYADKIVLTQVENL